MDEIETGSATSAEAKALAERMIDAGMAHLRPSAAPRVAAETVSVVIPVFDRADETQALLAGLARSAPSVHEIIIVDDASPARAALRLQELAASTSGVQVIRHDTNLGPAAARNAGARAVGSSRVLFLDSDCVVPQSQGWLELLLGHFDGVSSAVPIAAVAPRVIAVPDDRRPMAGPKLARYFDRAFCPLDMGPDPGLVGPERRVRYLPTAALLVDLDAMPSAMMGARELFDEDLRIGEDVDFIWRLVQDGGRRVVYEPSVEVGHRELAAIGHLLRRRFGYGTSAATLDQRHPGEVTHLAVSPWAWLAAGATLAGSVPVAAAAFVGQATSLDRRLRSASLPNDQLGAAVGATLVQSVVGIGRYLNQFWWPLVAAFLVTRTGPLGWRVRLAAILLGRSIDEVARLDEPLLRRAAMLALRVADEAAYGAGVWRGAMRHRSFRVIAPRIGRWKPRVT